MRQADGSGQSLSCTSPYSSPVRVFPNEDKSLKRVRTEVSTKKMATVLQKMFPEKKTTSQRYTSGKEGRISVDWVPFAKISVEANQEPVVLWNSWALAAAGFTQTKKDQAMQAFNATTGSDAKAQWSL